MSTSPIPPILDQDRYAVYEPTAATTDFALGFPLFGDAGDVAVFLDGEPLDLGIDYTVRSVAKGAALTPAPVTDAYVRLNAPISTGKLEIYGNFRPRRTIQATAPYGTRDFNFAFSLLMAAMREMWSKFTRAIKVPVGEEDLTIPSADERAGQVLAFDTTGKPTVGGRYSDLMASASAATISAANAFASASAAAASAAAAAKFNPAEYSTTVQIATMLESRAPTSRKLKAGKGLKLNGVAGTDATPVEADLSADLLFGFDLSAFAALQALWNAGADEGLHPISPAQLKAAMAVLAPTPPSPIGVGQTWQDVAGARAANISYQNTTGRTIVVSMTSNNDAYYQVSQNNITWITIAATTTTIRAAGCFPVPSGWYYKFNGSNVLYWAELR